MTGRSTCWRGTESEGEWWPITLFGGGIAVVVESERAPSYDTFTHTKYCICLVFIGLFWGCISVFICLYWISPVTTITTTDAFKLSEYGDAFGIFLSCVCGDRLGVSHKPSAAVPVNQSRYFKPKPDLGLNPTRWPLFLNLSKVQTQT